MNHISPLISVVMVNFNGKSYLEKTLPKILGLKYPNFEFIIVDNGSDDGSVDFIKTFEKIKLIKSPKERYREKNYACNLGVKKAQGKYIFLCDNDLYIQDQYLLDKLLNNYQNTKNIGILGISFYNDKENTSNFYGGFFGLLFYRRTPKILLGQMKKFHMIKIGYPHGIGFFIQKSIWEELGGYNEFLKFGGDDNAIGIKSWLLGYENYIFTESIQKHLGINNIITTENFNHKFANQVYAEFFVMFTYYNYYHLVLTAFCYTIFLFGKSIKQSIYRKSFGPFFAFFKGYYLFFKNMGKILDNRRKMKEQRKIKTDIFWNIKPGKIN
ncbi:glycosyltransferase [Candidatus Gracilibacteria bacterium]|nr:glycosyltransferase [Candidatus Gracilibacteria bacterium]